MSLLFKVCHYAETVKDVKPLTESVEKYGIRLLTPIAHFKGGYRKVY